MSSNRKTVHTTKRPYTTYGIFLLCTTFLKRIVPINFTPLVARFCWLLGLIVLVQACNPKTPERSGRSNQPPTKESSSFEEEEESSVNDYGLCKAEKVKGIYVFINANPVAEYQYLGTVTSEFWKELEITKGQKVGEVLFRISKDIKTAVTFSEIIAKQLDKVKEEYPEAEAVIFHNKLSQCDAITFKQ